MSDIGKPVTFAEANAEVVKEIDILKRVAPRLIDEKKLTKEEFERRLEIKRFMAKYFNAPAVAAREARAERIIRQLINVGRVSEADLKQAASEIAGP